MPLDDLDKVTGFDEQNLPLLNRKLERMSQQATNIRYTKVVPTANTVRQGELVVYDDQESTATRRCYVKTGDGTLVYFITFIDGTAQE